MKKVLIIALYSLKELTRKKDFYVFFILLGILMAFFYTESFFGAANVSSYLKDIGLSILLLFSIIITLSFSAKQLPAEIESKTIYSLLSKPVSRTDVILGKFTGSLFISLGSLTVFYLFFVIAVYLKDPGTPALIFIQIYIFSIFLLAMLSTFSILFSLFLTISANMTVTLCLYFLTYWFGAKLRDLLLDPHRTFAPVLTAVYYIMPHFEFYDLRIRLVHGWDPVPLWVMSSVTIYTLLYTSALLWISSVLFAKKDL